MIQIVASSAVTMSIFALSCLDPNAATNRQTFDIARYESMFHGFAQEARLVMAGISIKRMEFASTFY